LALIKKDDYAAAKIPMLPIIAGDKTTRKNILIYSFLLVPCSYLPWLFEYSGSLYLLIATIFGVEFLRRSFLIIKEVQGSEKSMFIYSIFYLSIIFAAICIDKII
jgi:protoheme IX farnesyltransferase